MANLKSIKKGDKVILRMFTGAYVEAKEVEKADAKSLSFTNKKGIEMKFDKATGKQISPEPKKPVYANYVEEWTQEAEDEGKAKKAKGSKAVEAKKKKSKKVIKKSKINTEVEEIE